MLGAEHGSHSPSLGVPYSWCPINARVSPTGSSLGKKGASVLTVLDLPPWPENQGDKPRLGHRLPRLLPAKNADYHLLPPGGYRGHCRHLAAPWAEAALPSQPQNSLIRRPSPPDGGVLSQSQHFPQPQFPNLTMGTFSTLCPSQSPREALQAGCIRLNEMRT